MSAQLDYIYFVYGLAFLLLGVVCLTERKEDSTNTQLWAFLAAFGFLHGISEWLDLVAFSLADFPAFALSRTLLMGVSFAVLLVAGAQEKWRWAAGYGLVVLGAVGGCWVADWLDPVTGQILLRWGLGLPAGALTALVLWHRGTDNKIKFISVAMLLYAIAAGTVTPPGDFFPASAWNTDLFWAWTGVPVQAVRCLLALLMAGTIWSVLRMSHPMEHTKIFCLNLAILALGLGVGWIATERAGHNAWRKALDASMKSVRTVAAALDQLNLSSLTGQPSDTKNAHWNALQHSLTLAADSIDNARHVYLLKKTGETITILLDAPTPISTKNNEPVLPPGEVYGDAPPFFHAMFQSGEAGVSSVYTDKWGTYISAASPILDTKSGRVLAVLGLDLSLDALNAHKKNERFSVLLICMALVSGFLIYLHYITRIKMVKQTLDESEQFNSQMIASMDVGVVVYDAAMRYQVWNRYMEKLSGLPASRVLGKRPIDLFPFLEDCGVIDNIRRALKGETSVPTEFPYALPGGNTGWTLDTCAPLRAPDGTIIGAIASVTDVTERKRLEQKLIEARDSAEKADKAKSEFLAVMSHEIRTPLNSIIGFSHLLTSENLTDEHLDYAQTILDSGKDLLVLINNILDYSKLESTKIETETSACSPRALAQAICAQHTDRAHIKHLRLSIECSASVPETILSDPVRIKQLLHNLTANAIKFTETGSVRLVLDASPGEDASHAWLQLAVHDTGIGIAADHLTKLFLPFSQVDASATRQYGGTGLGLAICKKICAALGGDISVASAPGQGSIFTVRLPVRLEAAHPAVPATDLPAEPQPNLVVLVVEDKG